MFRIKHFKKYYLMSAGIFLMYSVVFWSLWWKVYVRPEDAGSGFGLLISTGPLGLLFYKLLSWGVLDGILPSKFARVFIIYLIGAIQRCVLCPAIWVAVCRWRRGTQKGVRNRF